MHALDCVQLTPLMQRTSGKREIVVGLIDGPVATGHPALAGENVREIPGVGGSCARVGSAACLHGTFVAGILSARRGSAAPSICPGCTLLVRPIFPETAAGGGEMPAASPMDAAAATIECVNAGVRVINLSAALMQPSLKEERELQQALDYAAKRGVIVVAAAGNQGLVGSSAITRHPWVIPVAACDLRGRPAGESNLSPSLGMTGLMAPGRNITSLGANGAPLTLGGTSAAAPFVTGAVALLWSEFPSAAAAQVKWAITQGGARRRPTIVPPLLNAWGAHQVMARADTGWSPWTGWS